MGEIDLKKLGLKVIKQAIKDALIDETRIKKQGEREKAVKIKKEAIEFLTKPNTDLEDWCLRANLDYGRVLLQTKKVDTNPIFWKTVLKSLKKLEI